MLTIFNINDYENLPLAAAPYSLVQKDWSYNQSEFSLTARIATLPIDPLQLLLSEGMAYIACACASNDCFNITFFSISLNSLALNFRYTLWIYSIAISTKGTRHMKNTKICHFLHTFTETSLRDFQVSDDAQGLLRVAVLNEGSLSSITKKLLPDRVAKNLLDFRYNILVRK